MQDITIVIAVLAGGLLAFAGMYIGAWFGYKLGKGGQDFPFPESAFTSVFDDMPGPIRPTRVGEDM